MGTKNTFFEVEKQDSIFNHLIREQTNKQTCKKMVKTCNIYTPIQYLTNFTVKKNGKTMHKMLKI